jgi:hypothetical protein
MKNPLKKLSKAELIDLLNNVLHQAVASQYFEEGHKHRAHLWDIMNTIDKKVTRVFNKKPAKAFDITAKRIGLT